MTTRPSHFFVGDQGSLYDTREANWASRPLRKVYEGHFKHIASTTELLATLRSGQYAWPGGYPLYFLTSDGAALSFESVRKELRSVLSAIHDKRNDGWRAVGCDVNWEDTGLVCDHSGEPIESAYGSTGEDE